MKLTKNKYDWIEWVKKDFENLLTRWILRLNDFGLIIFMIIIGYYNAFTKNNLITQSNKMVMEGEELPRWSLQDLVLAWTFL
ncbi:MAG: hypothetical protein ABIV51_12855 [Saprospiraceae bacterium]